MRVLSRKIPGRSHEQDREKKITRSRDLIGEVSSSASEGVPGVVVAKAGDVSVKKNLVRAHAVALQDGCKSVVGLVEAKVAPVGTDRSSRCRKGATRAAGAAG